MSAIAADLMQFQVFELLPVFDVDDDITGGCSSVFVDVFTGTPQQQIYEEEQKESEHAPKCFTKTICSLDRPTIGVCSLRNEKKPDNEGISMCVNNTSDNTFSEDTTEFTFSHGHAIYADRSIELKNEKSTQATSTLCVREVIVHCHDERPEHINCTKGLDTVLLNFEQKGSLINDTRSNVVNSTAWELVTPPSHSINHAKLRLLWNPGTSASLHSSKAVTLVEDLLLYYSQGHGAENKQTVQWDPGIRISSSMNHYCLIFQKCDEMSTHLYWHQDIKFNGIALWLITFNPP